MTATTKVNISQWLIVIASALFGVWGGYSVLKYKVAQNEKKIDTACKKAETETVKVWGQFEKDRTERQENKDNVTAIRYDVKEIKHDMQDMSDDVKKILEKVE